MTDRIGKPSSSSTDAVLMTWLATRGDPFERTRSGGPVREAPGGPIPGPMLALLTDPASPYTNRISDAVILYQGGADAVVHRRVYDELADVLAERVPALRLPGPILSPRCRFDLAGVCPLGTDLHTLFCAGD